MHTAEASPVLSSGCPVAVAAAVEERAPSVIRPSQSRCPARSREVKTYLLLFFMMIFGTAGNALLDKGMKRIGVLDISNRLAVWSGLTHILLNGIIWTGIACLLLYMVSHMLVLSAADYSFVMPFTAVSYALVPLAGYLWLGERVAPTRWLGIALIVGGVFLVSRTPVNTTRDAGRLTVDSAPNAESRMEASGEPI